MADTHHARRTRRARRRAMSQTTAAAPVWGLGARIPADVFGRLGLKAPGAYSVYRLSLHSNGSPRGHDEAPPC
jgi:hypothetical protein